MNQKAIAFRAKVGIGQIYTRNCLLLQDGAVIGKVKSIHQVEADLNGEVFLIGWYLPQAIKATEPHSNVVAEAEEEVK